MKTIKLVTSVNVIVSTEGSRQGSNKMNSPDVVTGPEVPTLTRENNTYKMMESHLQNLPEV